MARNMRVAYVVYSIEEVNKNLKDGDEIVGFAVASDRDGTTTHHCWTMIHVNR